MCFYTVCPQNSIAFIIESEFGFHMKIVFFQRVLLSPLQGKRREEVGSLSRIFLDINIYHLQNINCRLYTSFYLSVDSNKHSDTFTQ